ncbi:MAG: hypothetical protein K6B44_06230 [Lachnospiraceae bacterium]|nr:hypothetical protein [Lachnospiraceae bacterium]
MAACLFFLCLFTACAGKVKPVASKKLASGTLTGYEEPVAEEQTGSRTVDKDKFAKERTDAGVTDESIEQILTEQSGRYFFEHSDDSIKRIYAEILIILNAHAEDILVSAKNEDEIAAAFKCVFQDHPEIFWISGYSYCRYSTMAKDYYTFTGKYTHSEAECRSLKSSISSYITGFKQGIKSSMNDYEKEKYAYEYIAKHTEYDTQAEDNQSIISVFLHGKSVCQGYAKAFQYLLQEVDIPCAMVVGEVYNGDGHAWNMVYIDGNYYHVDVTWGDSALSHNGTPDKDDVNYAYLNVTSQEIAYTRKEDNILALPYCVATEDNYYVKEKQLFKQVDHAKLVEMFTKASIRGERSVTLKCTDTESFEAIYTELVDEHGIDPYMPDGLSSYSISKDDAMLVLTFKF